jgi:hypothetical protein
MRHIHISLGLSALALAAAGCGGGGQAPTTAASAPSPPPTTTEPAETSEAPASGPVAEVAQVKALLRRGLATYRTGDRAGAERIVGDAYLEHFEKVEHALEERDPELMEELEVLISTRIRNAMKSGAPVAEVQRLVTEAERGLDRAATLLR